MLQKGFFNVDPFNPDPYWHGTLLINLSGSSKFDDDTVFPKGNYKIEVCSGEKAIHPSWIAPDTVVGPYISPIIKNETITQPFIIRAYCGGNGTRISDYDGTPGTNPYVGSFKVNAVDATTLNQYNLPNGIDVTHIFGAGGGNHYSNNSTSGISGPGTFSGGGGNCLGDGSCRSYYTGSTGKSFGGAGSCLHLLPVGGTFGINYLRCYHTAPGDKGSALGGGSGTTQQFTWTRSTRGGNSPYGVGGTSYSPPSDTGIGGADGVHQPAAYFDGTTWHDVKGTQYYVNRGVITKTSYIRITYLGPLN